VLELSALTWMHTLYGADVSALNLLGGWDKDSVADITSQALEYNEQFLTQAGPSPVGTGSDPSSADDGGGGASSETNGDGADESDRDDPFVCNSKPACRKQAKVMGLNFKGKTVHEEVYGCYSNPNQNKAFWGGGTDEKNYTTHLKNWQERINCDRTGSTERGEGTAPAPTPRPSLRMPRPAPGPTKAQGEGTTPEPKPPPTSFEGPKWLWPWISVWG